MLYRIIWGLYRGSVRILPLMMENQMEKQVKYEMEATILKNETETRLSYRAFYGL